MAAAGVAKLQEHPRSQNCREFLFALRDLGHRVVMSAELATEWRNHKNRLGLSWLSIMHKRRQIVWVNENEVLHEKIFHLIHEMCDSEDISVRGREAIEKDILLIVAARETDRIIVSLDRVMLGLLGKVAPKAPEVYSLFWIDPDPKSEASYSAEDVISWMKRGALIGEQVCIGESSSKQGLTCGDFDAGLRM